jgi:NAD(P)-dependent dehydrogenase (short-subunit alcohol dehydrogenase family)
MQFRIRDTGMSRTVTDWVDTDESAPLLGRTVVVVGASRGIGAACAEAAASHGARVLAVARSFPDGRPAHLAVSNQELDVTDLAAVERFFGAVGPVDGLVNAAGTNVPRPACEVDCATFDAVFAINVRASYFLLKAAAQNMVEHGRGGSLVTISSQMGHVGAATRTVYCASKHAVEGMTKAFALEYASASIRVNTVAPTFISTGLTEPMFRDAAFRADVLAKIPMGRIGTPPDVAAAAVFLLGDGARLITGTSIRVDGGWTAI